MKNDLSCEVVQDLLPSYVDGLTCEVTNQSVETHMQSCTNCSEVLKRMNQPEISEQKIQKENIDFLRKTRTKSRQKIIVAAIMVVIVAVAAVLLNAFLIGKKIDNPDLIQVEALVTDNHIALKGNLVDSGKGVSEVKFDNEDGIVRVSVLATEKSSFNENLFSADYDSESVFTQIWLGDKILWDNGMNISEDVADVYKTKHPYVENMPENAESALALGIWKDIGTFTNELQTQEEPYGWIIIGEQDHVPESRTQIEQKMQSYAGVLIAVIDNLDYVTFEYTVAGEKCSLTITEQDSDTLVGQSVKSMAKTPSGLQELMIILDLSDGYLGYRTVIINPSSDGEGYPYEYRIVVMGSDAP